jgi:hypothetical protein
MKLEILWLSSFIDFPPTDFVKIGEINLLLSDLTRLSIFRA